MAHSNGFSGFSVPKALQNAPLVEFLMSDSTACSYYVTGIVFKFVRGYSLAEIKKEEARRKKRGFLWENIEGYRRFERGLPPIRKLDTNDYALVLYFDHYLNDYVFAWEEISSLKPEGYRSRMAKNNKK